MGRNPFSDADSGSGREPRTNPFGEPMEPTSDEDRDPVDTVEYAAARIRRLKSMVGAEGLTLSATRELLDHIATALDAVARGMRR